MQPEISVIFPVGDRQAYLREAIASILAQTLTNFELLLVLDGVSEPVRALVSRFSDARIRCFELPQNMGVSAARNLALSQARAPYLALMDSDDVAMPQRLARQQAFLQAHPEVSACGTQAINTSRTGVRCGCAIRRATP